MTTQVDYSQQVQEKERAVSEKRIDGYLQKLRKAGIRQDALSFTKGQLESLSSTIRRVLYSNPRDAFVFLPLNTEVPDGHEEYSYRFIEDIGAAKVVADGAVDRPLVEKDLTKSTYKIYEFGAGYTYTVGDSARSGAILDFDYVQQKAALAAETIALAHNQFGLRGGAAVDGGPAGVEGFFNSSAVGLATLTDNTWTTLPEGDAQYATITDLIQSVDTGSTSVHSTTDVVLTTYVWNAIQATLMGDGTAWGSSQTVLAALRQNFPEVTFRKSSSGNGQGAGGVDRCVAYQRSADVLEYVASVVYDESAAIMSGFRWTIHSRGRAAGCVIYRPLGVKYGDITV